MLRINLGSGSVVILKEELVQIKPICSTEAKKLLIFLATKRWSAARVLKQKRNEVMV